MSSSDGEDKAKGGNGERRQDELAETKRIMERLVRTPPKPHKDKGEQPKPSRPDDKPKK